MKATEGQIRAIGMAFPQKGIENSRITFEGGSEVEYDGLKVFDGSFIAQIPNGVGKGKTIVRFDCEVNKNGYFVKFKVIKTK